MHTTPTTQFLRVPEAAVRPGNRIWLVRDGHLAIRKAIVAGVMDTDLLIDGDASDVNVGDSAVVSPLVDPYDGLAVKEIAQ